MSLIQEIVPYIQGDGLVANAKVNPPGAYRTCDNGVMFTAEYYIMANRNPSKTGLDINQYLRLINSCVGKDQELHRSPDDTSPDEVDDHYGTLAGLAEFNLKPMFKLPLRLWRQPQLLYSYLLSKGVPSFMMLPLALYNGLVIGTSCIGRPASDTDSRRLAWHLLQSTKRKSILAKIAGAFWHWRQTKVYGTKEVMKAVAALYYEKGHPFATYWVD